jgi:hypothetical protein
LTPATVIPAHTEDALSMEALRSLYRNHLQTDDVISSAFLEHLIFYGTFAREELL